jgi:hypothetical protein
MQRQLAFDGEKQVLWLLAYKELTRIGAVVLQRQSTPDYWDQIKRPLDPTILQLHKGLRKAESTVLIHLRTGRIGLRHSLYKLRVPEYESGQCSCRTSLETPRHALLECPYETEQRSALKEARGTNSILLSYWISRREPGWLGSG